MTMWRMKLSMLSFCVYVTTINRQSLVAEPIAGPELRPARPDEFSFVVAIKIRRVNKQDYVFCTGSVISKKHVLTAAHCFRGDEINKVEVLAGSSDLNACKTYRVAEWMTYEIWAKKNNRPLVVQTVAMNDIAVLTLADRIAPSKLKKALFSKKTTENLYGLNAQMVGWGSKPTHSEANLYIADVTILTREACYEFNNLMKKQEEYVPKTFLCAIAEPYVVGRKGDSGAPLVYKNKKILGILRGVSPNDMASSEGINIFISIDPYKDFINSFLN